jgi:hypothetical protein
VHGSVRGRNRRVTPETYVTYRQRGQLIYSRATSYRITFQRFACVVEAGLLTWADTSKHFHGSPGNNEMSGQMHAAHPQKLACKVTRRSCLRTPAPARSSRVETRAPSPIDISPC